MKKLILIITVMVISIIITANGETKKQGSMSYAIIEDTMVINDIVLRYRDLEKLPAQKKKTQSISSQMKLYEDMIKDYDKRDINRLGRINTFKEIDENVAVAMVKGNEYFFQNKDMDTNTTYKNVTTIAEVVADDEIDKDLSREISGKIVKTLGGAVSFYGKEEHGGPTASGEIFNMYSNTCAHKSLPFDTKIRVTNKTNGKSTICRVNDRGPYIKGREVDLSYQSFVNIASVKKGVLKSSEVAIEVVEMGNGKYKKNRIYSSK